jgi:hypothetical protein
MSKRIYVGLSKMNRNQLSSMAKESGVPIEKLEKAARGQIKLTETELKRVSRVSVGGLSWG